MGASLFIQLISVVLFHVVLFNYNKSDKTIKQLSYDKQEEENLISILSILPGMFQPLYFPIMKCAGAAACLMAQSSQPAEKSSGKPAM